VAGGALDLDDDGPFDLHAWIRDVAAKLLEVDDIEAGGRPGEIVRAVGLHGPKDGNAELRNLLQLVEEFDVLDENGDARPDRRGERMTRLVAIARSSGFVDHDISDIELRKRIERMFARHV
jgi:hypothetical protein